MARAILVCLLVSGCGSRYECSPLGDMNSRGAVGDGSPCAASLCVDSKTGYGYFEVDGGDGRDRPVATQLVTCDRICGVDDNCLLYQYCGWLEDTGAGAIAYEASCAH